MQKMYDSQCGKLSGFPPLSQSLCTDEAQRLRDLLRDRDDEIHRFEVSLADHEADEEKVSIGRNIELTSSTHANCTLLKPTSSALKLNL